MTSLPPCWSTKAKNLSLVSSIRSPDVVLFSILLLVCLEVC